MHGTCPDLPPSPQRDKIPTPPVYAGWAQWAHLPLHGFPPPSYTRSWCSSPAYVKCLLQNNSITLMRKLDHVQRMHCLRPLIQTDKNTLAFALKHETFPAVGDPGVHHSQCWMCVRVQCTQLCATGDVDVTLCPAPCALCLTHAHTLLAEIRDRPLGTQGNSRVLRSQGQGGAAATMQVSV